MEVAAPLLLAYEVTAVLRNKVWNRPTCYDAAYVALAELLDCEMWTADRRFVASLRKKAPSENL